MRQDQIKYASSRIKTLLERGVEKLKARHTVGDTTTGDALAKLVRRGKMKFKPSFKYLSEYTDAREIFDFAAHRPRLNEPAFKKAEQALRDEAARINDTLILGDPQDALAAIEAFAKRCA